MSNLLKFTFTPKLKLLTETTREGASLKTLANAAEKIGFRTLGVKVNFNKLDKEAPLACLIHWRQYHFVVVYKIHTPKSPLKRGETKVFISDPAHGLLKYSKQDFIKIWMAHTSVPNTCHTALGFSSNQSNGISLNPNNTLK